MKKIYFLATCDTCKRIMSQISDLDSFEIQNIKADPISAEELDAIRMKVSSFEELFNKRARKFQSSSFKNDQLSDDDFRSLILEEYTFLKRPVVLFEDKVFIGNSLSVVNNMLETVNR